MGGTDEALLKLLAEQQRTIERLTAALERMAPAEAAKPDAGPTLGDLIKRYNTVKAAANPRWQLWRLKFVALGLGKRRASTVDGEAWAEYSTARLTGKLTEGRRASHNTINVELAFTSAMLNWAVGQGFIPANKLAKVKKAKATTRGQGALREEHLPLVLDAAPHQMARAYILLGFDTGLRRFEMLALLWRDVDFAAGLIHVREGKGGKAGTVVATKRALDGLRSLPRGMDDAPVFANPETGRAYHDTWVNGWMRTAVIDSGVEKFYGGKKIRIHALRHGHATNTLEAGVPLHEVKAQLRHASISTTERYLHERLDRRRESMATKYEANLARKGPHRSARPEEKQEPMKKMGGLL